MQSEKNSILREFERSSILHPDKHALQLPPNIWTAIEYYARIALLAN